MAARAGRVRPGLDDKRLTAWNALAIHAFAEAGAVLGRAGLRGDRRAPAREFVLESMRDADGRLLRTWKDGEGKLNAYLEDHAFLLEALLALYEATFDPRWFAEARGLADAILARFADPDARRLLRHLRRPRAARRRGARTSRTPRSRRAPRRPRSACCASRR